MTTITFASSFKRAYKALVYDCQIVFDFVDNPETGEEEILLIDIGSHDEVY